MIINHKYKFIFLKTRKTAGTSIEIALSKFCDGNDIITPISKKDEPTRQELGFPGPQNYNTPLRRYSKLDWARFLSTAKRKQFYNHASAQFVRDCIGDEIWNGYFTFCFERNPFDKAISRYFFSTKEPRPEISEYLETARVELLSNWDIYTINDQIAVDFVGHYENLTNDLLKIKEALGLPEEMILPRAKSTSRENRDHYSRFLNREARTRLEVVCAKEIRAFNYSWIEL